MTSSSSSQSAIAVQEKLDETKPPECALQLRISNQTGALGGSISRPLPVSRTSRRYTLLEWSLLPPKDVMRSTRIMWIRYVVFSWPRDLLTRKAFNDQNPYGNTPANQLDFNMYVRVWL